MATRKPRSAGAPPAPPATVDLAAVAQARLFPVRHHSPRSTAAVVAFLETVRPSVLLVEGPEDATELIDVLVDPQTVPPVAILGYRLDGAPDSALWPFAAYSPEYAALRWARQAGVRARFIDVTVGQALAAHGTPLVAAAAPAVAGAPEAAPDEDLIQRCAERFGHRSFEEFWEALFEAPAYRPAEFRAALLAYAEAARARHARLYDRARDARMARFIAAELGQGTAPGAVAAVLGAAHVAALAGGDVDLALEQALPAPVPAARTLIPYSFPRLAEQLGYGAGNRAPQYYQRAHDAGCDYQRAALEVLVEFTGQLRLRGFAASLADTIEAYRLAAALAGLRGKSGPGLDEIREAAVATLCQGQAEHIDGFLWQQVIGSQVGRVAQRIGRNSLQEEFWREVRARRLPEQDELQSVILQLNNDVEVGTSTWLHRLRLADVPYATYQGALGSAGIQMQAGEQVGGYDALSRKREKWLAGWTPSVEAALVERIVQGDTMEQVARRALEEQLAAARTAGAAAHVLAEAVVARCPQVVAQALRACDARAAVDDDLPSLARACQVLSGLCAYGSARLRVDGVSAAEVVPVVEALCQRTFARAVLRVPDACTGDDEAVGPALAALKALHELALTQPLVDQALWLQVAADLSQSYVVNPLVAGHATALLFQAQALSEEAVVQRVSQRLSAAADPAGASAFLSGFFQVNTVLLSRNRAVVATLDGFLCGLAPERFRDMLPGLRRAFSSLGAAERRYLLENLFAVRRIGAGRRAAQAVLAERDKAALQAMSAELATAMDDLDDLL